MSDVQARDFAAVGKASPKRRWGLARLIRTTKTSFHSTKAAAPPSAPAPIQALWHDGAKPIAREGTFIRNVGLFGSSTRDRRRPPVPDQQGLLELADLMRQACSPVTPFMESPLDKSLPPIPSWRSALPAVEDAPLTAQSDATADMELLDLQAKSGLERLASRCSRASSRKATTSDVPLTLSNMIPNTYVTLQYAFEDACSDTVGPCWTPY